MNNASLYDRLVNSLPKFNLGIEHLYKLREQIALTQSLGELGKVLDNVIINVEYSYMDEKQGGEIRHKWRKILSQIIAERISGNLERIGQKSLSRKVMSRAGKWQNFEEAGEWLSQKVLIRCVNPTDVFEKAKEVVVREIEGLHNQMSL